MLAYAYAQAAWVLNEYIDGRLQQDEDEWESFLESMPNRRKRTAERGIKFLAAFTAELNRRSRSDYIPQEAETTPVKLNRITFTNT